MPKFHVLILEDDPVDVELMTTTLRHSELECSFRVVDNRASFTTAIENQTIDLVIADYSLPDFDGLSAIALVQDYDAEIPCILVSGVLGEERAIEALKRGATDYVLKGRLERLVPAFVRAIRERQERLRLKATTAALKASEERFRTSVETMVECLAILSAVRSPTGEIQDFAISYLNNAACAYLSISPKQQIGKPFYNVIPGFKSTIRNSLFYSFCFTVDSGKPFQEEIFLDPQNNREKAKKSPDPDRQFQQFVALEMKASKLDDGIVVTWQDITSQKQVEQQRIQLLKAAEQARNQAETDNHFKDEFIATLSHELRTPLNAIGGWIQLANKSQGKPDIVAKSLQVISRNTAMLERIISDILDVSRIARGKLTIDVQPISLSSFNRLVAETIEAITPTATEKKVAVRFAPAPAAETYIAGDEARLQQVVWNLLSNAIKFTPEKGTISVDVEAQDKSVRLSITDNGVGIDPAFLSSVFERFQQAGKSANKSSNGLGLGLSIVRHIIESHDGKVEANSEGSGKGSTFQVCLPLKTKSEISEIAASISPQVKALSAKAASKENVSSPNAAIARSFENSLPLPPVPAALKASAPHSETSTLYAKSNNIEDANFLQGIRVLVVEDQPDALDAYKLMLQAQQAEVEGAMDVPAALNLFHRFRPHVIISDIGLPGETGYDLIRTIRALPAEEGGHTPAVALSAYTEVAYQTRALLAGFQVHVPKPVDLIAISNIVNQLAQTASNKQSENKQSENKQSENNSE